MSKLISGKEALIALASGEKVECRAYEKNWINANNNHHPLSLFFDDSFQFRLKPRTITINGIEVPAPFEPKMGEVFYALAPTAVGGYSKMHITDQKRMDDYAKLGAWRTESEIKQVVSALRSVFKPQ